MKFTATILRRMNRADLSIFLLFIIIVSRCKANLIPK